METILLSALSGLVINFITWLSGKLGISKTYVSVGLAIFIGVAVYVIQIIIDKYPMQWQEIMAFASGSYAMSQVVWNLYQKITEQK